MIRTHDIVIAIGFSWVILNLALSIPYIGFMAAWALYEYGWDYYCQYRLEQERGM